MKNKILLISLAVVLAVSLGVGAVGCTGPSGPPTDKIAIGAQRSGSGGLETIAWFAFDPVMNLWKTQVNASTDKISIAGTAYPVEITVQDDNSQLSVMTSQLTAMITSGNYHFVFPPVSTSFLQAAATICTTYQYFLLGAEGGCTTIQNQLVNYKYLFATLNFSTWNQMEELFKILRYCQTNKGANIPMKIYTIYINDLHGTEYRDALIAEAANYGGNFTIVAQEPVAVGETNLVAPLQRAAGNNTDLFCSFTYPPTSLVTIATADVLKGIAGMQFPGMLVGPGGNFEFTLLPPDHPSGVGVGAGNMTDVMCFGAWNEYSSQALAELAGNITAMNWLGMGRFAIDWWGAAPYYAGLQCFEQAMEKSTSFPPTNAQVRDVFANAGYAGNAKFTNTCLGDVYFTDGTGGQPGTASGGLLAKECYAGQIGQWQTERGSYIFEVIDTSPTAPPKGNTAEVNWPKAAFP